MKKECAVVQDLLVLYDDDCLQEESRQMVEEHIEKCQECRAAYKAARITQKLQEETQAESELRLQKNVMATIRKLKISTTVKTLFCVTAVIMVLIGGQLCCNYITDSNDGYARILYGISSNDIEVTELYQLASGDIYCSLKSDKSIGIQSFTGLQTDPEEEGKEDGSIFDQTIEIRMRKSAFWEKGDVSERKESAIICPVKLVEKTEKSGQKYTCNATEIVFYGRTRSDEKVLWKRGQEIAKASDDIEYQAIRAYLQNGEFEKAEKECKLLGWNSSTIFGEIGASVSESQSETDAGVPILVNER